MNFSEAFQNIINDLKGFITYLASLSGILSAVSAFFPLVNQAFSVITPPKEYPDASLLIATLACVFLIFHHFTTRNDMSVQKPDKTIIFLPIGLAISYVFVVQTFPVFSTTFLSTMFDNWFLVLLGFIVVSIVNLIKPVIYVLIFYFFTDIFATLAIFELIARNNVKHKRY